MKQRLSISEITPLTTEWTCKVQNVDKFQPRDNRDQRVRFRTIIVQDENTEAKSQRASTHLVITYEGVKISLLSRLQGKNILLPKNTKTIKNLIQPVELQHKKNNTLYIFY
uniref:Uncharacterized protein LOC104218773 n=1 Tax=Nicotiana sylvestris TaxID=4096 RepID=A0A1U7VHV3_NICSY|nr:PREDICTED: uncharacterized protein LOC104218773 [Nicotiana sylvestris]XP_009767656.1 PREDICTED: uncharacterized protein LOC104218773 [Nicotiana sylvestris]XP_009767657.1 PREDICTED: uncharacterized protein LOC104218773 [Nicotiana sylvestris]XP_009767658.1 PREDICTED: uncharacterized protein LOC104218773 [Nicotiana sylvestris]